MGFFEPPPAPPPPPPEPRQPSWIMPPSNVLGAPVPLELAVARTDQAAVIVRNIVAYPAGMEFALAVRLREAKRGFLRHPFGHGPYPDDTGDELLRFGVQFSDGTRATTLEGMSHSPSDGPPSIYLGEHGGSGRRHGWDFAFWLWPLPPPGPLAFVAAWPSEGVPETRVEIDAALIRDAASSAEVLWDDQPISEGGIELTETFFAIGDGD